MNPNISQITFIFSDSFGQVADAQPKCGHCCWSPTKVENLVLLTFTEDHEKAIGMSSHPVDMRRFIFYLPEPETIAEWSSFTPSFLADMKRVADQLLKHREDGPFKTELPGKVIVILEEDAIVAYNNAAICYNSSFHTARPELQQTVIDEDAIARISIEGTFFGDAEVEVLRISTRKLAFETVERFARAASRPPAREEPEASRQAGLSKTIPLQERLVRSVPRVGPKLGAELISHFKSFSALLDFIWARRTSAERDVAAEVLRAAGLPNKHLTATLNIVRFATAADPAQAF